MSLTQAAQRIPITELSNRPTSQEINKGVFVALTKILKGLLYGDDRKDLTITGTNWTTDRAKGSYRLGKDGAHLVKFSITGHFSAPVQNNVPLAITGVTPIATLQPINAMNNSDNFVKGWTGASGIAFHAGTSNTIYYFSGEIEVESKPNWA